ncbi:hypothetical protein Pmar_PMAR024749 [Perkinsus marinus ATCC 50983]|uniref:Uncharacterized protein n=1 Tax=Perkinsus marinus (strain ATCC 50983 / TXsc) TaxID=423536 RepID=C5M175_PERM5|nr:hypothetical protein Pmar_PMAR024749 [Perkinsus marinus ATCC 50983]EEQ97305.1 hypothetical protein Pmar_PMAR024749 [Perkinsus marinus ATCC 50983]|eukprot:XP_002764588.1 hypothetical protein Pmar_PMAR024749 [Perkinsus marinus ATCC 50983]
MRNTVGEVGELLNGIVSEFDGLTEATSDRLELAIIGTLRKDVAVDRDRDDNTHYCKTRSTGS